MTATLSPALAAATAKSNATVMFASASEATLPVVRTSPVLRVGATISYSEQQYFKTQT
jgi:hypothetical protein